MTWNADRCPDIVVEIAPQSNYLSLLRNVINSVANQLDMDESMVGQLEMCIDEACANSISAMNEHGIQTPVRLEVIVEKHCVRFTVYDSGEDFSHHFQNATPMDDETDRTKKRGYGLRIIKTFMDEVQYHHDPEEGNRLHLIKYL